MTNNPMTNDPMTQWLIFIFDRNIYLLQRINCEPKYKSYKQYK